MGNSDVNYHKFHHDSSHLPYLAVARYHYLLWKSSKACRDISQNERIASCSLIKYIMDNQTYL